MPGPHVASRHESDGEVCADGDALASTLGLARSQLVPVLPSVPVPSSGSGGPLVQPDVGSVSVPGGRDRASVQPLRPRIQAGEVAPPALHT